MRMKSEREERKVKSPVREKEKEVCEEVTFG